MLSNFPALWNSSSPTIWLIKKHFDLRNYSANFHYRTYYKCFRICWFNLRTRDQLHIWKNEGDFWRIHPNSRNILCISLSIKWKLSSVCGNCLSNGRDLILFTTCEFMIIVGGPDGPWNPCSPELTNIMLGAKLSNCLLIKAILPALIALSATISTNLADKLI